MRIIKDEDLGPLIQDDLRDFISLSSAMTRLGADEIPRHLIGRLHLEASKCEEMLDAFGASGNAFWAPFRMGVAVAKAFSRVIYNLFHIAYSATGYKLLKVEGDFVTDTWSSLKTLLNAFSNASMNLVSIAYEMELLGNIRPLEEYRFLNTPIDCRLESNQTRKTIEDPRETAVFLATNLLNLAEESSRLDMYKKLKPDEYHTCIPDIISEAQIRYLANNFHNLQSTYDTYLPGSYIAKKDKNIPVMKR